MVSTDELYLPYLWILYWISPSRLWRRISIIWLYRRFEGYVWYMQTLLNWLAIWNGDRGRAGGAGIGWGAGRECSSLSMGIWLKSLPWITVYHLMISSQHNILLFPKKNLETCILSIAHAILMQPLRVKTVAVTRNSIPVGSKANTGRNALDRMVKMGEKRSMTNVLRPIKKESRLACAGR
mgnify:CR=1 FL=1